MHNISPELFTFVSAASSMLCGFLETKDSSDRRVRSRNFKKYLFEAQVKGTRGYQLLLDVKRSVDEVSYMVFLCGNYHIFKSNYNYSW